MRKLTIDEVQPGMDVIYEKTDRSGYVTSFMIEGINIPVTPLKRTSFKGKVLHKIHNYSSFFPQDVLVCDESVYDRYKDMDFFDILNEENDMYAIRSVGQLIFIEPNKANLHFKEKLKDWGDNE